MLFLPQRNRAPRGTLNQTQIFKVNCPPWAFPGRLCNSQGIGTPHWQLKLGISRQKPN
jgi:hypothetical protein